MCAFPSDVPVAARPAVVDRMRKLKTVSPTSKVLESGKDEKHLWAGHDSVEKGLGVKEISHHVVIVQCKAPFFSVYVSLSGHPLPTDARSDASLSFSVLHG